VLDTAVVDVLANIPIGIFNFDNGDDLPDGEREVVFVGRGVLKESLDLEGRGGHGGLGGEDKLPRSRGKTKSRGRGYSAVSGQVSKRIELVAARRSGRELACATLMLRLEW